MKKFSILLAAIAVFGAVELSAQTVNEVNTKYNEAVALIQNKNYAGAIPVLEQAVEMGLNAGADAASTVTAAQKLLPTCYFQNGLSLCKTGNFDNALASLDKAVMYSQLFQDFKTEANARKLISQTYTFMGAKAFNEKDWAKAIEIFSKGYESNPKDTDLALYLAESYAASGDYENGLKVYRDVMALEQQHSRYAEPAAQAKEKYVYYQLLRASEAASESDKEGVYAAIDELLTVDPTNAQAQLLRIQTATNAQDWANVIAWGEAAAEAQTDADVQSDIYYMLGAAYQNTENKEAALATYAKVTSGNSVAAAKTQVDILTKPAPAK